MAEYGLSQQSGPSIRKLRAGVPRRMAAIAVTVPSPLQTGSISAIRHLPSFPSPAKMPRLPAIVSNAPAALRSCILLLAAVACAKAPAKPPRAPVSVLATTVRRAAVPFDVEANGTVTPLQTSNVAAQVDGLITEVAFREGQEVVKGQVLFRIDPRPYQAALDQAQAVLARDRAAADVAQEEATRYETLMKGGYATREEASLRRASALSALATVDVDKAQLANARFNLDNTTVRAPIAGRTGAFLLRAGNLVRAAGGQPLVVIHQVRPILVRFAVPGAMLPLILRYGGKGGLAVTAAPSGASSAGPGGADRRDSAMNRRPADSTAGPRQVVVDKPAESGDGAGTLTFIDNAVDTTTGTVQLKASFENRGGTLWVGQFVSTILRLFTETDALVVPNQAVLTSQRGS